MKKVKVSSKDELLDEIYKCIRKKGITCDLNHIDVSGVRDMSELFMDSMFNGDISGWDTSNVENMNGMFANSMFNRDISGWNVSNVKSMKHMFTDSRLKGNEPDWYEINLKVHSVAKDKH